MTQARTNALALRNVIAALMEGPQTYLDLAEVSGLHDKTIRELLVPFRKAPKLVRIGEWHEDRRGHLMRPAFVWGNGPDAKRKPLSNAERQRRAREKKKAALLQFHACFLSATPAQ